MYFWFISLEEHYNVFWLQIYVLYRLLLHLGNKRNRLEWWQNLRMAKRSFDLVFSISTPRLIVLHEICCVFFTDWRFVATLHRITFGAIFPTPFFSFCVSHFGDSHNISLIVIIITIIFVMMIYNQCVLTLLTSVIILSTVNSAIHIRQWT